MKKIAAVIGAAGLVLALGTGAAAAKDTNRVPPANDNFSSAQSIVSLPFSATTDTRRATLEATEPQPSCGTIGHTVWYSMAPATDATFVAETASTFSSILAVYQGSDAGLSEVACGQMGTGQKLSFPAAAGDTYFVQVGDTGQERGTLDFHLSLNTWKEQTIAQLTQPVTIPDVGSGLITLDGRPRADNTGTYDLSVGAIGQPVMSRGVYTFGLVRTTIHEELVHVPATTVNVTLTLAYRYDTSQLQCLSDGGPGQPCTVDLPVRDIAWLTRGDGSKASLVIGIAVSTTAGRPIAERSIEVPLAGQVIGMVSG